VALVIAAPRGTRFGAPLPLDGVLEALAGTEGGARRRADPDLLAGARVAAGARLALLGLEGAEARDLHAVALAEGRRDDAAAHAEERLHRAGRIGFAQLALVGQGLDQIGLVHDVAPPEVMKCCVRLAPAPGTGGTTVPARHPGDGMERLPLRRPRRSGQFRGPAPHGPPDRTRY